MSRDETNEKYPPQVSGLAADFLQLIVAQSDVNLKIVKMIAKLRASEPITYDSFMALLETSQAVLSQANSVRNKIVTQEQIDGE
ncbi:MAG: hypothetical protein B7X90_01895 [Novosphingobium sp. 17-62-19]|uniref:hypothetical protein n=1 Tax=Novosphingobium sp. 17-62-19 TaxID=1970406 RepID=UPI000BC3FD19|nr:hypothetical protein [Novosphingobium sp. 17-62-19]OZA21390.1 MAG: hypothetical protein B7X90_01895 [Novosphingobium sp. 17-62-19]HQS95065.1 hypothetical protein [Novosphingobium sp.]